MKALHCSHPDCNSVHSPDPNGLPTSCDCGRLSIRWTDAHNGFVEVKAKNPDDRHFAHVISLHNGFLNDGPAMIPTTYYDPLTRAQMPYPKGQQDTFWRQVHQNAAVAPPAPEMVRIWDASARNCWAVILTPGQTADVVWAGT